MVEMQQYKFHELSGSSKNALAWALAQARLRESTKKGSSVLVSAVDLLVGILQAHPGDSEPEQLLQHFQLQPQRLYDILRATSGFFLDNASSHPEQLNEMPPLDTEAEYILNESFSLSKQFNPETEHFVRLRDLFGGILTTSNKANELLRRALSGISVPFQELADKYPEYLRYPSREKPFSKFLTEWFPAPQPGRHAQSEVPPAISFAVSGFTSDTRTEKDLIGIGAEVDAFAYLIAAKALQPPMAIGLFGDWGSGKSFFMEAMRQRIHKITADAQQSGEPQGKISIYKYIAQIEFNAWHYVEGELWASLVEHIFRNLKTRPEDEPTLLQQRQQLVIEQLEIARRAQQAAQARKIELESELSEVHDRVARLEKERENALKKLNDLKATDILKAVRLSDEEERKIRQTLKDLGVTETYNSAAELMRGADELRDVIQRGNALSTPLRERGWKWAAVLIFVILIGPVISLVITRISNVPVVTNALASVSAFLSGLTIMLKRGASWLSSALARVEGAHRTLDAKRREVEAHYAGEIIEAERQYNEKAAEFDQAKNEEKAKERQIAELEKELQQITPGRVLLDFISERVGSQDYRKHLGIAALIRSDFDQLSHLIADQNEDFIKKDDGKVREEDRHMINRIVLYIDDLDRCPPDRVVQVLQAVHLLLAFQLFVVVVAVDARWLSQSLLTNYQNLLVRDGPELSKGFGRQASPQDYLEKIFQIPFWVRPLPEKARIRIINGLVAESLISSSGSSVDSDKKQQTTGQRGESDKVTAKVEEERDRAHWEASERKRPLNPDAKTELKPESLDIQTIELQFMDELRSLLGETPRSVKRFVNVYRLIKAISLNPASNFIEDEPQADFKLVLFLLAVLTGLPAISREFFRQLHGERADIEQGQTPDPYVPLPNGRTLAQVLDALRGVVSGAPEALPDSPTPARRDATAKLGSDRDGQTNGRGYEDWYALRDLDRLETWLKQYDHGSWLRFDATALADWTPQVVRFSYRIEEL